LLSTCSGVLSRGKCMAVPLLWYTAPGSKNNRLRLTSSILLLFQMFLIKPIRWSVLHRFVLSNISNGRSPGSIIFLIPVYGLNLYPGSSTGTRQNHSIIQKESSIEFFMKTFSKYKKRRRSLLIFLFYEKILLVNFFTRRNYN
jgi:hypothetical protein